MSYVYIITFFYLCYFGITIITQLIMIIRL
jgi:hypothetical protein